MAEEIKLKKISEMEWEIPKTGKMLVPVKVFASEKLLEAMKQDATLKQAMNMAKLPGVLNPVIVLSDAHQGYGACIGGVSAMDLDKGVISPGQIGYDIDCSVRLLKTNLKFEDIKNNPKKSKIFGNSKIKNFEVKELIHSLFRAVPSGVGRGSNVKINWAELDEVLKQGAKWTVKKGYGIKEDLEHLEENGCLSPCNPDDVSKRAKQRGIGQLGTLGAGNHFLEIQKVEEIFDFETAKKLGLEKNQVTIMIHCGSRGLGHQVASDYIKLMEDKYGWPEFDRELVNAPIKSELGKKYFSAMNCAANFAFANKQIITHWVRENLKHYFPDIKIDTVYEVCHNIAKIEEHIIEGKKRKILVMRKGATRSFPNQPVLIPGSMGTASYVLIGTEKAMELSFASAPHGAGRIASRTSARKSVRGEDVKKQLDEKGIDVEAGSWKGLSEEAPQMYKDIDEVVRVSHEVGIGKLVAKLVPVAVMKG